MNLVFMEWRNDGFGVPHAIFSHGSRTVMFNRAELAGAFGQLHNQDWLAQVAEALERE